MADYLYIEEYASELPVTSRGDMLPIAPLPIATQRVAVTAASTQSAPLNERTAFVIMTSEVPAQVSLAADADPAASATGRYLPASLPRAFRALGGRRIAVILRQA